MLSLANDYLVIDDPITISYQSKSGEQSFGVGGATYADAISVAYVYQESITKDDVVKSQYLLQGSNGAFNIWTANLPPNVVPKIADLITDPDAITWVVKIVEMLDRDANGIQRYRCLCLKVE
jgi:hypothetical protein